jgi:dihydroneopterin aldolase / 2-amino-4-hydroxy-6-hydroxymethyldihydropteridine diphosphokinase / dihydropteroate synthase
LTIEACTTAVAHLALTECNVNKITVRIEKPNAITFANSAGIEITRRKSLLKSKIQPYLNQAALKVKNRVDGLTAVADSLVNYGHVAFLGIGSNLGDRVANIKESLKLLEMDHSCKVLDTSFLYDTSPMYNLDQPRFINAACKVTEIFMKSKICGI